jgi:hypothetical protein
MAKHTPGPWEVRTENAGKSGRVWRRIPGVVEPDWYEKHSHGETETYCGVQISEANARLIAAAPDLLAALKASYATFYDKDCELGKQVAAAIAKAESPCVS